MSVIVKLKRTSEQYTSHSCKMVAGCHVYSPCETMSVAGQCQAKLVECLGLPVTMTGTFCQIVALYSMM